MERAVHMKAIHTDVSTATRKNYAEMLKKKKTGSKIRTWGEGGSN